MIELTDEQLFAIMEMENWYNSQTKQLFEISGAAGTGKTTLVQYLIERLGLKYNEVLFVAFMGKAATQLSRHGLPAKTIHSAIYDCEKVYEYDEEGNMILKPSGKPKTKLDFVLKKSIGKHVKLIVVDEGAMVNQTLSTDLKSFNKPIIVLGDKNQLPPVFGDSEFLVKPDITLRQIMRQAEGDPIIWLSQEVLAKRSLKPGVYKNSAVIRKKDLTSFHYKQADMVLTGTNYLRHKVNSFFRENLKKIKQLEYPHLGEKVISKKNNWNHKINTKDGEFYLTNGLTGFVDYVDRESYDGKSMKLDFRPDFTRGVFKNVKFDYNFMYSDPEDEVSKNIYLDIMEYAYAITVHSSQGSQWDNVLYLADNFMRNPEDRMRFNYTAITRASKSLTIVLDC